MTDAELIAFVERHTTLADAARELGVPRSNLFTRLKTARRRAANPQQTGGGPSEDDEQIKITRESDRVNLVASFKRGLPPEEIMRRAGFDPKLWEIVRVVENQWQVTGKKRVDGNDKIWRASNFQVSVTLKRKAPRYVQDSIESLFAAWSRPAPLRRKERASRSGEPHLLEVSLVDAHFGKLCWGEETGEDYDLKTAHDIYLNAVDDLVQRAGSYNIERIVFPVGQDFFNVDNWAGTTEHGTLVDSTDDRFTKVFTVGVEAIRSALLRCREIAPVRVLWSPGNHDRSTSWYLCKALAEYFKGVKADDVDFDLSPRQRKYELYGNQLLAWTHGCDEKPQDLPLIMAQEAADLWGQAKYKAWHMGHFHKKKETRYTAGDTFGGVSVSILPSLSGTDSWHSRKGWSTPQRSAEAYVWSREKGLSSYLVHNL